MKPRGPTEGSAPVCCATSGVECWDVKAQFSGILVNSLVFVHKSHFLAQEYHIPILRIMWLLERITHTSMSRSKHLLSFPSQLWPVKFHLHQLVHILQYQHIAIQLHDSVIFGQ